MFCSQFVLPAPLLVCPTVMVWPNYGKFGLVSNLKPAGPQLAVELLSAAVCCEDVKPACFLFWLLFL